MNWGWNGFSNGWYSTWTPPGRNYNSGREMITNITP